MSARNHGATIRTRTRFVSARRESGAWRATIEDAKGREDVIARAIVNASGPWVAEVLGHGVRTGRCEQLLERRS